MLRVTSAKSFTVSDSEPVTTTMAEKQLLLPSPLVKMHNTLARATWPDGGQYDLDIVMHIASKIRVGDEDFKTYRFPVSELGYGKKLDGRTYTIMKDALERLAKSSIKVEGDSGSFYFYSLFSMAGYENGTIVARFDPEMKPFFLHLTQHFTSFELFELRMLPSGYSKRLFLLLKSFSSLPETTIPLAILHEKLGTPDSFKGDFAQMRRWVVDKAKKDLKNILAFEWEPVKKGRTVTAVRFVFDPDKKAALAAKKPPKKEIGPERGRNRLFLAAVACAEEKDGCCTGADNKASVCKACRDYSILGTAKKSAGSDS